MRDIDERRIDRTPHPGSVRGFYAWNVIVVNTTSCPGLHNWWCFSQMRGREILGSKNITNIINAGSLSGKHMTNGGRPTAIGRGHDLPDALEEIARGRPRCTRVPKAAARPDRSHATQPCVSLDELGRPRDAAERRVYHRSWRLFARHINDTGECLAPSDA
jgi:hypothetical protein